MHPGKTFVRWKNLYTTDRLWSRSVHVQDTRMHTIPNDLRYVISVKLEEIFLLIQRCITDGIKHCMDGSDESIAYCNARVCPQNYIECNNRRCVPANQTCMDNSTDCGEDQFKCSNGQCIDLKYRCDRGRHLLSLDWL